MAKDFTTLFARPVNLARAVRRIALGGLMAATGLPTANAAEPVTSASSDHSEGSLRATIVDRSRKAAKLVLQIPGATGYVSVNHRSHRSHSSHRSHVSATGGGVAVPVVPPVAAKPTPAPTVLANTVSGEIESIDKVNRTFVVKVSATLRRTFAYRDDTKIVTAAGISFRFDELSTGTANAVPIAVGNKVQVQWRTAVGGASQIATTIQPTTLPR